MSHIKPFTLLVGLIALMAATASHAVIIVTPNANAVVEGTNGNFIPFDFSASTGSNSDRRYQQRAAASQFGALLGPSFIDSIAFRRDADLTRGPFNFNYTNIALGLSTLSGAITNNYGTNRGADFTTVYSGALSVSVPGVTAGPGPNPFAFVINFQTPFLYDPTLGDLLWEWQNFGTTSATNQLVLDSDRPGPHDRVFSRDGSATVATGMLDTGNGLVTQFTTTQFTTVPEPTTLLLLLLGLGLAGLGFSGRRRLNA